jgi:hypothetical protein
VSQSQKKQMTQSVVELTMRTMNRAIFAGSQHGTASQHSDSLASKQRVKKTIWFGIAMIANAWLA